MNSPPLFILGLLAFGLFHSAVTTQASAAGVGHLAATPGSSFDFGDAPAPYPTLKPNGAAHVVQAGFGLGTPPDAENDGFPEASAKGDDTNGVGDEDGVTLPLELVIGRTNSVAVRFTDAFHASPFGNLVVWIDLDGDGSWNNTAERFGPFLFQQSGIRNIAIAIPSGAKPATSFARFRLSSDNPAPSPGGGSDAAGEVEDHQVTLRDAEQVPGETGEPRDFGDAPDMYRTRLASNGPRHARTTGFNLGKLIDVETNAVPPLNGLGDDLSPVAADDEDGVTFLSSASPGQPWLIQVVASITNGTGKLDAWADWNRNGTFADAGDRILTAVTLTNGVNLLPAITVLPTAGTGPSFARFRLTRQGINSWFGPAGDGEVEDYVIQIRNEEEEALDFGDAPQTANGGYPTRLARNGARHHLEQGLRLGKSIDLEADGQPNATATGDDSNGSPDEDGVFFPAPVIPGVTNAVQVEVASPPGVIVFLDAWIDFNRDGDWADPAEKIFSALPVAPGTHTLNFAVPATAGTGVTFARFRLSQQGGLNFTGDGGFGEVEDLRIAIATPMGNECDLSCEGNDFWIAFPGNYAPDPANPVKPTLCIAGPPNTVVTIENLAVGNTTVLTNVSGTLRVELSRATDLGDLNDAVARKAVHITSNQPITLYGLSKVTFSSDGFLALPTEALGTEYVVAGFGNVHTAIPELNGSQFALAAVETNTTVTVIPQSVVGDHLAGVAFSMVLTNRGDCYQLRNLLDAPSDLTGTIILSDRPIAVFGGHQVANVASADPFFADYLVEALLPVKRLGREFYTTPLATRTGGDTFRLVAATDNTTVTINNDPPIALNRGGFHEVSLASASQIVADKPLLVMQYANSSDADGVTNADPFMVTVPGRPHWSATQVFTTPGSGFSSHHVNIVVSRAGSASLRIDGAPLTSFSSGINGTDYVYATTSVSSGTHTVTCSEPVGVIVYGWNEYESYAYPACLFLGDITPPVVTCLTNNITVIAGHESDRCKAAVGDYRGAIRASDNCGLPGQTIIEQNPPAGTLLGVGRHQIQLSVRDAAGNIGSCFLDFVVVDPNPGGDLRLICPDDMLVNCTYADGAVVDYVVSAFQGCTPATESLVCTPPPGLHFPPGTNVVTCTLSREGQPALVCTFRIIVACRATGGTVTITPPTRFPTGIREVVVQFDPRPNVVLEVADSVVGPWRAVPNAPFRYVIRIAQERGKFFRLRERNAP